MVLGLLLVLLNIIFIILQSKDLQICKLYTIIYKLLTTQLSYIIFYIFQS